MVPRAAPKGLVLLVEDEPYVRESLDEMLRSRGFETCLAASPAEATATLLRVPADVVLTDLRLGAGSGLDLVRSIASAHPEVPVIVLTGFGTIASAVECIKSGAADYLLKPADPDSLIVTLERALSTRALRRELKHLRVAGGDRPPIGASAEWKRAVSMVEAAAPTDATVLLLGESGTGKEVLARMTHRLSARAAAPWVRVNCAAIPNEMWESEFFGHRKGSYTGATADREGRFLLAHRGTLFMDEIGSMPLPAQAKILRVLQDGEFDRLGDERPTRVDVRVVAATNSDLAAEVAAGRFRSDLYYRLNVVTIEVPALRSRPADIEPLTRAFVEEIAARLGRAAPAITPDVVAQLAGWSWPGNVRELRNVLERALILHPGETLHLPDLAGTLEATATPPRGIDEELNLRNALGRREKELLEEALRRSAGVRKEAARLLGIDQRNLAYYLRKHGLLGRDPAEG